MKHFEFWNPRLFELPYYLYLIAGAARRGLSVRALAKANYGLDHGEIGIGSKYQTQQAFDQKYFLPTIRLPDDIEAEEKARRIVDFAGQHGYPLVLKSDIGSVGKGVAKIHSDDEAARKAERLVGPYLLQKFTPLNDEYGVFYVRHRGVPAITAINRKHFPTVIGDGIRTVAQLVHEHPRRTGHWKTFLQYVDLQRIPAPGESVQLSFIGSHTMGCKFTDDTGLLTPGLEKAIFRIFEDQPGFNFGRLDVKAADQDAFRNGEFVVIEVNGVASLPTNMFDPDNSLFRAYRIFLEHGHHLLEIASEHRHQSMELDSWRNIVDRVRENARILNRTHEQLMDT